MVIPQPTEDKILFGQMVIADKFASAFPLERTEVTGQLTGLLVSIAVKQYFRNPLEKAAELEYLFPLPENAAVFDFELTTGERVIRGEVRELEQAREEYEQARRSGKQAALVEERRPNLFAIRVANILPGSPITTSLHYQQKLKYDSGQIEFVFPMGITPKFEHPDHPDEGKGTQAPIANPFEEIGPVSMSLAIQAGLPVQSPESPSHPLTITRLDETRFQVSLKETTLPNHDFVLHYRPIEDSAVLAAWVSPAVGGDYFTATLLPPVSEVLEAAPAPRDFIFVLDRSGSMSGEPIAQARNALRACLRALNSEDTFRILLFDHDLEWFRDEAGKVTQSEIDAADAFLAKVEGRGGTDIVRALQQALRLPEFPGRTRYIVFLTDGAVSAEDRAFEQVRQRLGNARIFTFGIGPSVNRALLNRLAQMGRGAAEFLQLHEDIEGAIIRFQDRVSFPVLTDLEMRVTGASAWDVYPARLPDLYYGQPVEIAGRVQISGEGARARLEIRGKQSGREITMEAVLSKDGKVEPAVARAWARARLDDLLDKAEAGQAPAHKLRGEIIALSLEHHLLTPFTALVAIDEKIMNRGGEPTVIYVSQPLPEGLDLGGFIGRSASMPNPTSHSIQSAAFLPSAMPNMLYDSMSPGSPKSVNAQARRAKTAQSRTIADEGMGQESDERPERVLRSLARTQNVDGSWQEDVELTSAVLLLFIRHNHTTHQGYFRVQMRKAVEWLAAAKAAGTQAYLRAAVLKILGQTSGELAQKELAQRMTQNLPAPSFDFESSLLAWLKEENVTWPENIGDHDNVRLAALLNHNVVPADGLLAGDRKELARLWLQCITTG